MAGNFDLSTTSIIGDVFKQNAQMRPNAIAFEMADGERRTFYEVYERLHRLIGGLKGRGAKRGDRVAILSKNCTEFVEIIGISAGGFIPVPLNWRLSARELSVILGDCKPSVLIYDPQFKNVAQQLASAVCIVIQLSGNADGNSYEELLSDAGSHPDVLEADSELPACLLYTSGTTGAPKGAVLTHSGLLGNCRLSANRMLSLTTHDVTLAPMPFFHVGGFWYHLFPSFASGCKTIILPEFRPELVLQKIEEHQVTNVHLVPTMIQALLDSPRIAETNLSSLRLIFYAASSIPLALLKRAMNELSCDFVQGYGSTECGMITCLMPEDHKKAITENREELLLSCGKALPGISTKLVDSRESNGHDIGEIIIQSANTMREYWKNPEASQKNLDGNWMRTGDLAREQDGYFYIVDRKSDMIVSGGENVYPREAEEVLFQHPDVTEVAVFDLPDDRWIQKVVAAVVLKSASSQSAASLIAYTREHLASYKCPKEIFIAESLPKSGAGKVLRRILRETYASGQ